MIVDIVVVSIFFVDFILECLCYVYCCLRFFWVGFIMLAKRVFVIFSVLIVLAGIVYSAQNFLGIGKTVSSLAHSNEQVLNFIDSDKKIPAVVAPHIALGEPDFFPASGVADFNPGQANPTINFPKGRFEQVVLLSSEGKEVAGKFSENKKSWEATEPLRISQKYSFQVTGFDRFGRNVSAQSSFSTFDPPNGTNGMAVYPLDGMHMGVGQPVSISFKYPIADRSVVENGVKISNSAGNVGHFHWLDDYTVRYRAENFWDPGNVIEIKTNLLGIDLGEGRVGAVNRNVKFTVGSKRIATVDDERRVLVVRDNDVVVREIPVSMGMDRFPTPRGIHIVAETHRNLTMDSTTWGLSNDDPDGYRTDVEYATRLSNGGVFAHAAPWAINDLGKRNVSHGCLNMTTEDAKWVSENMLPGDVFDIQGTKGDLLPFGDGYGGDWNVPWSVWSAS